MCYYILLQTARRFMWREWKAHFCKGKQERYEVSKHEDKLQNSYWRGTGVLNWVKWPEHESDHWLIWCGVNEWDYNSIPLHECMVHLNDPSLPDVECSYWNLNHCTRPWKLRILSIKSLFIFPSYRRRVLEALSLRERCAVSMKLKITSWLFGGQECMEP